MKARRKSVPLPTLEEEIEHAAACIRQLTRDCVKRQELSWGKGKLPPAQHAARHAQGVDFWCGIWAAFDKIAGHESPFTNAAATMAKEVALKGGYDEMKELLRPLHGHTQH